MPSGWDIQMSGVGTLTDQIEDTKEDLEGQVYVVGTTVRYAVFLEFGTSEIPPYPFMGPAVEKVMAGEADRIANEASSAEEVTRKIAFAIEREAKYFSSDNVPPGPDEQTSNLNNSIRAVPAAEL